MSLLACAVTLMQMFVNGGDSGGDSGDGVNGSEDGNGGSSLRSLLSPSPSIYLDRHSIEVNDAP